MKNKSPKSPFEDLMLDAYEQEIEDSIPEDISAEKISKKELQDFMKAAAKHRLLKSSKRINIRINNQDLAKVKAKSKINNIPYQTLLGSLVHKYAEGELEVTL